MMNTMRKGPITSNYEESEQTRKRNWTEGPS